MIVLVVLLMIVGEEPPLALDRHYEADAAALRAVGGREMFLPIRECFRRIATEQRARTNAAGDKTAATAFMHRELSICGYHKASARLLSQLRHADPSASERIVRRRAEVELLPVRGEAEMYAEYAVRMPPPPPPVFVGPTYNPGVPGSTPPRKE